MRLTVIVLVLVNIGFFIFGYWNEVRLCCQPIEDDKPYIDGVDKQLMLRSEIRGLPTAKQSHDNDHKITSVSSVSSNSEPEAPECLVIGPFVNVMDVYELENQLFVAGVTSQKIKQDGDQQVDYWVHIPPLPSRESAIMVLRELQVQKIDSFVITRGELVNGISLGLFSDIKLAESVRRRLMHIGYTVAIKSLSKDPDQWWLEMNVSAENKLGTPFWNEIGKRHPKLEKLKKSCKNIARFEEFL